MKAALIDVHVYVSPDMHERLREYAHEKRLSHAEVTRRALDDYLPKIKKKPGQ